MAKERIAVIDLGTNTFKYTVVEGDQIKILADEALPLRLGAMLEETGNIGEQAMQRGLELLARILEKVSRFQPEEIICVGAMTLRTALDAPLFISLVKEHLGLDIRVLSGMEEATLAWDAAVWDGDPSEPVCVLDIGGGSAELIFGQSEINERYSLRLGAVILSQRFIHADPPATWELMGLQEYIRSQLETLEPGILPKRMICIGGSAANLAAMQSHISHTKIEEISALQLQGLLESMCDKTLEQRKQIPGLDPQRADIIIAGALMLQETMKWLKLEKTKLSMRGIRHAIAKHVMRDP